ncbi:hypothetical protein BG000_003811, partial [Podila horticola]
MANVSKSSRTLVTLLKKLSQELLPKNPPLNLKQLSKAVMTKTTKVTQAPKTKSKFKVTSPKLVTSKAIKSKARV